MEDMMSDMRNNPPAGPGGEGGSEEKYDPGGKHQIAFASLAQALNHGPSPLQGRKTVKWKNTPGVPSLPQIA